MALAYKDLPLIIERKERYEKLRHILAKGKEQLVKLRSSEKERVTLYDALDAFPLTKFKQMLEKAGLIELLKQRTNSIVIAPIDEAFEQLDPLIAEELNSAKGLERLQTLARSHIIVAKKLLINSKRDGVSFDAVYDLNGDVVDLALELLNVTDMNGKRLPFVFKGDKVAIQAINDVMPFDPFPHVESSITKGEVRTDNGWLIPVANVIVGKSFLEQKYMDRFDDAFGEDDPSKKHTLWECFLRLGCTRFSRLIEEAGLVHLFTEPHEHKATRPAVFVPIDEAFTNISEGFIDFLAERADVREDFIKSKIGTIEKVFEYEKTILFYPPAGKMKASNGKFFLTSADPRKKLMRWVRTEFIPIST